MSAPGQHDAHERPDELVHCKVCGGAEASLPTICPGRRMTESEQDAVQAGRLNFEAVRGKRLSELSPAQQDDAHELWLREQLGWMAAYYREQMAFLLKRLDEVRELKGGAL